MEFVTFELAKKLKEKGFNCKYPFAMYDKYEQFCPLYSSDKYYFGIDDFDKHACIAPTISQVLKWLREEKKVFVCVDISGSGWFYVVSPMLTEDGKEISREYEVDDKDFSDYNSAALAGIEYVINNLI